MFTFTLTVSSMKSDKTEQLFPTEQNVSYGTLVSAGSVERIYGLHNGFSTTTAATMTTTSITWYINWPTIYMNVVTSSLSECTQSLAGITGADNQRIRQILTIGFPHHIGLRRRLDGSFGCWTAGSQQNATTVGFSCLHIRKQHTVSPSCH